MSSLFLQSMPSFWLGIMLILLFAVALSGLLPADGTGTLKHLILPAVALTAAPPAQNVRLIRAGMLETVGQDYVRTARAKGVAERGVVYRHAPSVTNLILVLGVTGWITYARIVRGEVLTLRERDFVAAARTLGAPARSILARHLMPNVLPPITVVATFSLARTIIAEASLSFLGLGIPAPEPSGHALSIDDASCMVYKSRPNVTFRSRLSS